MICPVLDALSHLTLELKQARDEVLRLCCVCFHFLVYYGFSGCKDTHYFLNVKAFPLKQTKNALLPTFHMKNTKPPPTVAERRRTLSRGEVRKDGNPCKTATQNPAATV